MSNRGRREAMLLTVLLVAGALALGVVAVVHGGTTAELRLGSRTLDPMPSAPVKQWKSDATTLFGEDFRGARLSAEVADELMIVTAYPNVPGRRGALVAVDPATGRPLWTRPRTGWDAPCAMSRDKRLACTRIVRRDGAVVGQVLFLDPRTGRDLTTETIRISGYSTIVRAGDGFLVVTTHIDNIGVPEDISENDTFHAVLLTGDQLPDERITITRFDSHGHRQWTMTPPVNHRRLAVSETGNTFAASGGLRGGSTVYRLDTGRRLFSVPQRARGARSGDPGSDAVVVDASGYLISHSESGHDRIDFFDDDGMRTGELTGWRVSPGPSFGEPIETVGGDALPVVSSTRLGIASTRDQVMRWETPSALSSVQVLGDRYLATSRSDYSSDSASAAIWTVFDAHNGSRRGAFTTGFGQRYIGFDGTRLLFEGDADADESPNRPTLTAYDAQSGNQVWQTPATNDSARWQASAPYLLLLEDAAAGKSPSIARYAA